MKLQHLGKSISVSIDKVTQEGVWLTLDSKEVLLDFESYPWFKNAPISCVFNAERLGRSGIGWEELDVHLSISSILKPEDYPLKSSINRFE
ncbi:DUF2442 domain-containing protein [Vibrio parahaemolyticus]|uniref:DUF2442 domain-containing protein n=1 Tax=Vibrio parahaemolyticus TaxID=670 RepID=UPI00397FF8D6